ncbi:hypothetical protein Vadar_024121 [Vaccinium darrowii]|uniref:Uncharacterized protein n=1 Tax=Vaccinium darrowii TaxID=229202 RepID=A0ACB7YG59_9ERIC|nr:hypothetical protein Vadar_024121 [Vaccinium darrowii]
MALCNSKLSTHLRIQQSQPVLFLNFLRLAILFLLFPFANSITFNLSNFKPNDQTIDYTGDAFVASGVIQLTKNLVDTVLTQSAGRATYSQAIHLWDSETGNLTDFNTHFTFMIQAIDSSTIAPGDGLTFFLCPYNATIPNYSSGGFLGLFNNSNAFNNTNNQIVAVEFDTYQNSWDPSTYHVGIDVNSIESVANLTWDSSMANNQTANVWVNYDSNTTTLSVYLTYDDNPVFQGNYTLSYVVDLSKVLPEWISVGFSAATGKASKESDVYSFGVVALEIACGRKPVEVNRDPGQVRISEWVWSLYGKGQLFEAVGKDLTMEYDEHQVERLMLVGLWCCHPDPNLRPSIRQAINILTFEAQLPILPSQMPVPIYLSPPMCMPSYSSSVLTTDSNKDKTQCSSSTNSQSCYSSFSIGSTKALLQNHEDKE